MAAVYFASDNSLPGRDGSINNPLKDPGELGTPYTMLGGNDYLFRCDTTTNFAASFGTPSYQGSPITVGQWGSGVDPEITYCRQIGRDECVEVALNTTVTPITMTPQAGTKLWRVPREFFGLLGDGTWAGMCDVTNRTGSGQVVPAAAKQMCGGMTAASTEVTGLYGVIYSDGNPVDVYGGLIASNIPSADFGVSGKSYALRVLQAHGGVAINGLQFASTYGGVVWITGTATPGYNKFNSHTLQQVGISSALRGLTMLGDAQLTTGTGYTGARVRSNTFKNMGNTCIDSAGGGCCFNDGLIDDNVLDGFCRSLSWGGIYLGALYTDNGSMVMVEGNSASGGVAGNYWANDGYAMYQEELSSSVQFRRNFVWDCDLAYHNNNSRRNNWMVQNVCIGKAVPRRPEWSKMFGTNGGDATTEVTLVGNVSVGNLRFISGTPGLNGIYRVLHNVSLGSGPIAQSGEGALANAIRTDHSDYSKLIVDGNNFFNHDGDWVDNIVGTHDAPPYVLNRITTDPSPEIARLPMPVDPGTNYAKQLSPNWWDGAPNLRPGTRLVPLVG